MDPKVDVLIATAGKEVLVKIHMEAKLQVRLVSIMSIMNLFSTISPVYLLIV